MTDDRAAMRPESAKSRAAPGRPAPLTSPTAKRAEVTPTVAQSRAGCPCGCRTRLPWLDDPDCVRHRPLPQPHDWPVTTTGTLGVQPHDRDLCRSCQAVGA